MHRSVLLSPHSSQTIDIESRRAAEIAAAEQRLAGLSECAAVTALHFIGLCFDDFPRIPKDKLIAEVVNWRMDFFLSTLLSLARVKQKRPFITGVATWFPFSLLVATSTKQVLSSSSRRDTRCNLPQIETQFPERAHLLLEGCPNQIHQEKDTSTFHRITHSIQTLQQRKVSLFFVPVSCFSVLN